MVATNYLWDMVNDNVLAETDENGDLVAEYTYEPDHFGNLISQERDGVESFYHFDVQGSTRALTDENGDVTDTYTYTAFGQEVSKTGTTENPYGFVGEKGYYFDEAVRDYYVRARSYVPRTARWKSKDAEGFVDGINVYVYVLNNPLNWHDPSGQECCCQEVTVTADEPLLIKPPAGYGTHRRSGFRRGLVKFPSGEVRWYFNFAFVVRMTIKGESRQCTVEQTIDRVSGTAGKAKICRGWPITRRKGDDTPKGPAIRYTANTISWQDLPGYRHVPRECVPALYHATFTQRCTGTDGKFIEVSWRFFHRMEKPPTKAEVSKGPNLPGYEWVGQAGSGDHMKEKLPITKTGMCC